MKSIKDNIDLSNVPNHVAIIMDGNGRWAQKKGFDRIFGHKNAVESVRQAIEAASEIGLKYLTLYTFSTENWDRPQDEINALMDLLVSNIEKETSTLNKNNIRLIVIGDTNRLPKSVFDKLQNSIEATKNNEGSNLVIALSYSSRWEILNATKAISQQVLEGTLKVDDVDERIFSANLTTGGIPDPDLLIRTSGELRISNFLLWQIAYTELYFTEVQWPDFRKEDFFEAILTYQKRERRFGKTGEQVVIK